MKREKRCLSVWDIHGRHLSFEQGEDIGFEGGYSRILLNDKTDPMGSGIYRYIELPAGKAGNDITGEVNHILIQTY